MHIHSISRTLQGWRRRGGLLAELLIPLVVAGVVGCGGRHHEPASLPAIQTFEASRAVAKTGTETTLTARFSHGEGWIDQGIGRIEPGQRVTVKPATSTSYTLTVVNKHGATATKSVHVEVEPALIITVKGVGRQLVPLQVTGPQGFRREILAPALLPDLPSGEYCLEAAPLA